MTFTQDSQLSISSIIRSTSAVLLVMWVLSSETAFGQLKSTQQFNSEKSRWGNYAAIKQKIRLEGRLSSSSPTLLKLRKCELTFRKSNGTPLPKLGRKAEAVEVEGYLVRDSRNPRKFFFHVTGLRERPSDLDVFNRMKRTLPPGEAKTWYSLGKWARNRGQFYEDKILLEEAEKSLETGLQLERARIARDDWGALRKLIAKAKTLSSSTSLPTLWTHEVHRMRWTTYRKSGKPTFAKLISDIEKDWPASTLPMKTPQPKWEQSYLKDPLATYRQAKPAERKWLHRILYREIQLQEILSDAHRDGSNGFLIAGRIEKIVPERKDLVKLYRDRALSYRKSKVEKLSRAEAIELAKLLREHQQDKQATESLRRWLKAQHSLRKKQGAIGLMLLAEDYIRLINDKKTAIELLKQAHQLSPETEEPVTRLKELGYHLKTQRATGNGKSALPTTARKTIAPGKVTLGMNPEDVRRAMFGPPTTIFRSAARRNISEIWVYGKRNEPRLVLHFRRKIREPRTNSKVVNISRLPATSRSR
ncbi:MAG: hypothetical protein Tsb009_21550 [Planctomycetaceae bacterium]